MSARRNAELGAFLKVCRGRLSPHDAGLRTGERRRVQGLRREEVADLAGVSPDYYARLEQGRQLTASPSVLNALAQALRLSDEERAHLRTLAGAEQAAGTRRAGRAERAEGGPDADVGRVLEAFGDTPALVCRAYLDVRTVNEAAAFLFTDFDAMPPGERNALRWMLLSTEARDLYGEQWENSVREMVGMLRIDSGRYPDSRRGREIVAELEEESAVFRGIWRDYQVSDWHTEHKTLWHPEAGALRFHNASVVVDGAPGLRIFLIVPDDRSAFEAALRKSGIAGSRR